MKVDRRELWLLLAIAALVIAAAGHAIFNELVWDDLYDIGQGTVIFDPANLAEIFSRRTMFASVFDATLPTNGLQTYRPLTLLSFFWDAAISGREPLAYHLTNLAAHLGCVALVWQLCRRLLPDEQRYSALFAAAWFGVTPVLLEAHVWINGRSDVFMTLYGLGALLAFDSAIRSRRIALHVLAAILFLCAMLSKDVALLLGPLFFAWPARAEARPIVDRGKSVIGLAIAAAIYLAMRTHALGGLHASGELEPIAMTLFRIPAIVVEGIRQLLLPTKVHVRCLYYEHAALGPVGLGVYAALAVALGALVVKARKLAPVLPWSVGGAALILAPVAVIAGAEWPGFGRYLYLPAALLAPGFAQLAALAEQRVSSNPRTVRLLRGAGVFYVCLLAAYLHVAVYDWRDEIALYESWASGSPDEPYGYSWLGLTYLERGEFERAIPPLARAAELAPNNGRYRANLINAVQQANANRER